MVARDVVGRLEPVEAGTGFGVAFWGAALATGFKLDYGGVQMLVLGYIAGRVLEIEFIYIYIMLEIWYQKTYFKTSLKL